MRRVGLIGCGTIGSQLAASLQRRFSHAAHLAALHDIDAGAAAKLKRSLRLGVPVTSLAELIRRCDLVLEAASAGAVGEVMERCLKSNRDVLIMSVGGLLLSDQWRRSLRGSRSRVYIPSGALAGLDGVKAMALGRLTRAQLTTRKPPKALQQAAYVQARGFKLLKLRHPRVIFTGSPRQVVKYFPQNTNVAAALALASGLPDAKISVRVVADPALKHNRHELDVEGDCGRLRCFIESAPSRNPKTSELAVRSAVATLHRIFDKTQLGT